MNASNEDETDENQKCGKVQESNLEKCEENSLSDRERKDEHGELKNASCQTDFQEGATIFQAMQEEFELEKAEMQNSFTREQTIAEMELREEYDDIVKTKNKLIRVLTEEKDFLWSELKDLRNAYELFMRRMESSQDREHKHGNNFRSTVEQSKSDVTECDCDGYRGNCHVSSDVDAALRVQKEQLLKIFEKEKIQRFQKFEQQKIILGEIIARECEVKYSRERAYLLESVDGLKEGLTSLTQQKDELARIFEGEKNAMEMSFARKEKELKQQMKLDMQKKLIQAHASWAKTQL